MSDNSEEHFVVKSLVSLTVTRKGYIAKESVGSLTEN